MAAFLGTLTVQIDADTKNDASHAFDRIVQLASGFPCVERITVEPVAKKSPQTRTRRRSHA